jgi:membrane protease YdiL (CAAX protease family)
VILQPQTGSRLPIGFVTLTYVILAGIAWLIAQWIGGIDLFVWHDRHETSLLFDAGLGIAVGAVIVLGSRGLERIAEWARELGRGFGELIGTPSVEEVFVIAVASGVGEEIFFRGCLQQGLSAYAFSGPYADWAGLIVSSLLFGGLHVRADEFQTFLPWTLMAIAFGGVIGWIYMYTGNLLGPILAHFTINFFNLLAISRKYGDPSESR